MFKTMFGWLLAILIVVGTVVVGIAIWSAVPIWIIWFLYAVFYLGNGFFSSLLLAMFLCAIQLVVALGIGLIGSLWLKGK